MRQQKHHFVPWMTGAIILLTVLTYLWERQALQMGLMNYIMEDYAFHWDRFVLQPLRTLPTLVSYTFFHADSLHIKSNLFFFLLFASSVERVTGRWAFLLLYFFWGALAAVTQGLFQPFTGGLIGASGAISGAAGAFFVLHPLKMPFRFLNMGAGRYVSWIPAFTFVGLWFGAEVYHGVVILRPESGIEGITNIAHWAHIGGFTSGALSMIPFIKKSHL